MPRKSKSGAKSEEDRKVTKRDSDPAGKPGSELEEKEKSIYLIQIRHLSEKLQRFEQKCDALEREKKDLSLRNCGLEKEKADIVGFLRHALQEKEEEVEKLRENLENVQKTSLREREETQRQHSVQIEELQHRATTLTAENTALVEKKSHVERFLKEKNELVENLEALKKQLSQQEKEHRLVLHNLDIQALMEKKRWEEKLELHVGSMEAQVQSLVTQRLPETTSGVLQENLQLREHCSLLSEHTQGLLQKNSALHKRKTEAELDLENLEQMFRDVSRKNCVQKKVVEQLTERCAELQTELSHCRQKHQKLHSLHSRSLNEMETLRQDKASVSKLGAELQQERRKRSEVKSVLQNGCKTLKQAMEEIDGEKVKINPNLPESEHVEKWELLLQKLLVLLEDPPESATVQDKPASRRVTKTSLKV